MTSAHSVGPRPKSRAARAGRGKRPAVQVVDGVQMSCDELDDDLAVIHFFCRPAAGPGRRPRRPARES
ncbi:MAG TPA: hypothetical protein VHO06_12450 [Polyangia bacterium]|nr:hypothetical protein [Polyangia bacterium]